MMRLREKGRIVLDVLRVVESQVTRTMARTRGVVRVQDASLQPLQAVMAAR
jgi:hypothetical protein